MKIAIFGSGHFGKCALSEYGFENVECFIDNSKDKIGKSCENKTIISLNEFKEKYDNIHIIIAVNNFVEIAEQLRKEGVEDFEVYIPYTYNNFEDLKKEICDYKGTVVMLGIDSRSEMVYRALLAAGIKKEQILLSDLEIKNDEAYMLDELPFVDLRYCLKDDTYVVVSSDVNAYTLQTYMKREYPECKVLNPFVLRRYGDKKKLIVNPYEGTDHELTEKEWIGQNDNVESMRAIQSYMEELAKGKLFFEHIEIETFNRCNGVCDFCPVSVGNEKRVEMKMSDELFMRIIDQLAEHNYSGKIATFSNNEPFLDERIVRFNKYTREKLPNARIHLFTNGTVLKLDTFIEIINYLDEIVIDNYNQQLELISPVRKIVEYCEEHKELIDKVTVVTRKPHEIRTSRGGDAPNREKSDYLKDFGCVLPFKQMIVRPDGKVSLCCNDPYGKYTMGDLSQQTIDEVWHGEAFRKVRRAMLKGRKNYGGCRYCDTTILF